MVLIESIVSFVGTLHDEMVFSVVREEPFFTEISLKLMDIMFRLPFEWKKPLTVSIAVGDSWGKLFPFQYDGNKWRVLIR